MYLVPIAWLYVTVLMAVAEATNSNGSVLGALITLVVYGVIPVVLIVYLFLHLAINGLLRMAAHRKLSV